MSHRGSSKSDGNGLSLKYLFRILLWMHGSCWLKTKQYDNKKTNDKQPIDDGGNLVKQTKVISFGSSTYRFSPPVLANTYTGKHRLSSITVLKIVTIISSTTYTHPDMSTLEANDLETPSTTNMTARKPYIPPMFHELRRPAKQCMNHQWHGSVFNDDLMSENDP